MVFMNCSKESRVIELHWPSIWVGEDSKAAVIASLVDEFNNANIDEIKVIIEPHPEYDSYRAMINSLVIAGSIPDILIYNPDAESASYDVDLFMDFSEALKAGWKNNFTDSYLEQITINGQVFSLPYEVGVTPIWYNKELLIKAGYNNFPKTYSDFLNLCEVLKTNGITPMSQNDRR
jgi:raffinose/stachyose/melibiose transport system substrate-binding protein